MKRFIEQYRLPFPVGRDTDGRIGSLFDVDVTPASLFIARDGKLVERVAQEMEGAAFEQRVISLLEK
jgi:peroxiredoxin